MKNESKHKEQEIQLLAAFVHGALSSLHALGAVYNAKRKNYNAAAIHCAVAIWDCVATLNHMKKGK